jgi:CBS domain-containing protein
MARIRELLKNREVFSVEVEMTVQQAAVYMMDHNVGAVPVLRGSELAGVFSERDIVRRVMAQNRDWKTTRVGEVMTPEPLTVSGDIDIQECMLLMKHHGFRHLPVSEDGHLVGFVSMRDLLLHDLDEKEVEVRMMRAYMASGAE